MTVRIAVVGLGAAGACMVTALNHRFAEATKVDLTLYDACPPDTLWRGRAFQRDGDAILANVPAQAMSIQPNDPSHARVWLESRGLIGEHLPDDHESFLPRRHYGDYLADTAERALAQMRARGWGVARIEESATGIEASGPALCLTTRGGRRANFDYIVLCPGGSVLSSPWGNLKNARLIANPYPTTRTLAPIPRSAAVGILGSGLTAVDIVVALQAQGHQGPINMISRTGTLNRARMQGPPWMPRHLTMERVMKGAELAGYLTLRDAERLLAHEARDLGGRPMLLRLSEISSSREELRRQLTEPMTPDDLGVYAFQKSVPSVWQDIWYFLREPDKRILLTPSRLRAIMSRCCPMPPPNARKILDLLDSGQLTIDTAIFPRAAGPTPTVQTARGTTRSDYLISAMTPAHYGVAPAATELMDSAIRRGLASTHFAGGVLVERSTSRVHDRTGTANPRLYALGDLTRGAYFFTFGLPVLVTRSAAISQAIYAHTSSPHVSRAMAIGETQTTAVEDLV